jgi:hypothetical protein
VLQGGQEPEVGEKGSQIYVEAGIPHLFCGAAPGPYALYRNSRNRRNQSEDLAFICSTGGGSLEFAVERRSLHSRPMLCDHCRRSFGLIIHRYWRMRFCSADCLTAYQRRLDQETIAKIRWLDFVGTTNKARVRG